MLRSHPLTIPTTAAVPIELFNQSYGVYITTHHATGYLIALGRPTHIHTLTHTDTHTFADNTQNYAKLLVMCDMKYFIYCLSRLLHIKYVTIQ